MPFGTIKLNDGTEIPEIAYGTGTKWKGKDVVEYVEQAIETGFNHIDTAQFYETEGDVGTAIRETGLKRDELYITTKFGYGPGTRGALEASLQKLGLKQVDLYLVHQPRLLGDDWESEWKKYEQIKEDGLAKSIGVSNFTVEDLQRLLRTAKVVPAVNQIRLHPYNYAEVKPILDLSKKYGIVIEAYSSLTPITQLPGGPVDKPLADAAARRDATPTQIIFLWIKSKGAVIVTTSSTKAHLEEYLAVGDLEPLTEEEIAAIEEAAAKGPPSRGWVKLAKGVCVSVLGVLALLSWLPRQ